MSTTQLRIVGIGILFVLIFAFGYLMSRSGKPYNTALITVHKLASLGAIALLILTIVSINHLSPLGAAHVAAIAVTGICFLITLATGGLLSAINDLPQFVSGLHQVIPYVTLLSTAGMLYLLFIRSGELIGI